jgi:hypothetical protein
MKQLFTGLCHEALHSFSMIRNIKSIMSTDVVKGDMTYLHGIRVLSLFWIILFHVNIYTMIIFLPVGKYVERQTPF